MATYRFKCDKCGKEQRIRIKSVELEEGSVKTCIEPCDGLMYLQLPTNQTALTYKVNKFTGQSVKVGVEKELKERSTRHARKYEYAERIDKFGVKDQRNIIDKIDKT